MKDPAIVRVGGRGWDCNQFLLKDPASNAYDLVDAGHGLDFERIRQEVARVCDPGRIRTVAITHEHLDHVNGIPKWKAMGAKVAASGAAARKLAEGRDPTSEMFGGHIPKVDVDLVMADGDTLPLGGRGFQVLEVPGHSPGSACYWDDSSGVLFSGDTLFADGGIGRFDFPDGDLARLGHAIDRLGRLPVRVLHCGHGDSSDGDAAARSVRASVLHVQQCMRDAGLAGQG
jgi:glyoxylase-like metal-dependent hydrolase (beta-lactamase superfamily II)